MTVDCTGTSTDKGIVIKLGASQSADAFEVQNSSGTVLSAFNSGGLLGIGSTTNLGTFYGIVESYSLTDQSGGALANLTGTFTASAGSVGGNYGVILNPTFVSNAQLLDSPMAFRELVAITPKMAAAGTTSSNNIIAQYVQFSIGSGATNGTIANLVGWQLDQPTNAIAATTINVTSAYGIRVLNQGTWANLGINSTTGVAGIAINAQSGATNNTALLIGTTTIPSGNFAILS